MDRWRAHIVQSLEGSGVAICHFEAECGQIHIYRWTERRLSSGSGEGEGSPLLVAHLLTHPVIGC